MTFTEFESKIVKRDKKKGHFKIRNSFGVYDAFKYIRKNGWYNIGRPLKEKEFYSIIRGVNNLLAEELSNGNTVVFPHKMGKLELRRIVHRAKLVDGKLKVSYPTDWHKTIKLWYEDEEARNKKTLIRLNKKETFFIKYFKFNADYNNQVFYEFHLNRFIQRALIHNTEKGKIDSLW